ncbi:MAG: thioredoxin family protein [Desulfovibrio sp.]|nr:thioredoxin family protein [Desulfovibrio sp.]
MARQVTRLAAFLLVLSVAWAAVWSAPLLAAPKDKGAPGKSAQAKGAPVAPVLGMVTVVEFGADYCPPCRLMKPILQEATREYRGRAAVVSIDVTLHQDMARRLGVQIIPTLVFYDATGMEQSRHEGYLDKKALYAELDGLLGR